MAAAPCAAASDAPRWHNLTFVSYAAPAPSSARLNDSTDSDQKADEFWKLTRNHKDFGDLEVFVKSFGRAGRDGYEVSLRHNRFPLKCVKVISPKYRVAIRPLITCCPQALELGLPKDGEFFEEVVFVQESSDDHDGLYHCPRGLGVRSEVLGIIDKAKHHRRSLTFSLRILVDVFKDPNSSRCTRVMFDLPQRFFLIRGNYSIPQKTLNSGKATQRGSPANPAAISEEVSVEVVPNTPNASPTSSPPELGAARHDRDEVVPSSPTQPASPDRKRSSRDDDADALRVLKKLATGPSTSGGATALMQRPAPRQKNAPVQFELLLLALDYCTHVEVDDSA